MDVHNKETYEFTKLIEPTNNTEVILTKFLFDTVGSGSTFTDKQLKDYAKSTQTYDSFNKSYTSWKNTVVDEGIKQDFWDNNSSKALLVIFSVISFGIFYLIDQSLYTGTQYLYLLGGIHLIFLIYLFSSKKRTAKGNEDYAKWNAFKNFLKDFGQFQDKDLPQIILWERYLVYATVFGLANQVQKAMNVKIKEMNLENSTFGNFSVFDYMIINNMVNHSVSTAVRAASQTAAQVASSRASSAGGFGGGSSFGGGGFGGGGSGGGRF